MSRLRDHGLTATLPAGWEGRIFRRGPVHIGAGADPSAPSAGITRPVLHAATFALPEERGDFGQGAVERMRTGDAFVVLFEHGPEGVDQPLFAGNDMPRRVPAARLRAAAVQRALPGHRGFQAFFTERNRAFCLYVVVAGRPVAGPALEGVNRLLGSVEFDRA